ncbi:uncharacterized protein LOC131929736 [Physella acuta]|uniref:uncharacterized protein LOC131929736 n=1 Tax=Physella acuta TaxID=109671 RepID=UPI0027DCC364|nr:uncharacterized protein LOC131929736 [Physella acuta]
MSISCLSSFGCLAARTWAPALQAPLIVTGLSIVAKLGVGASFGCCNVWMGEIYPTVIRSLAYGVTNTLARVGGILSPYAVNLEDRVILSYVIMGSMSGLCVLLTMFVEETKDSPLHESLHQVDVKIGALSNGVHKQPSGQLHFDMNELNDVGDDALSEAKMTGDEPNEVGDKSWNQEEWQLVSMNTFSSLENDHDRHGDGDLKNDVVTPNDDENDDVESPRENGDDDSPNEHENCDVSCPNNEEKCDACLPNENITCSRDENNIEEFNQRL